GRQVTGVLNRWSGGGAQGDVHLGGDDHRQGGLAQPGRTGQQHVIRRPSACACGFKHQGQLLAQPLLTDEVGQGVRTQRVLYCAFVAVRLASDQAALGVIGHQRASVRSAARNSCGTSSVPAWSGLSVSAATVATARSASRADHPRPSSASCTCSDHPSVAGTTSPAPTELASVVDGGEASGPTLSLSSRTIRAAPFFPMPGTVVRVPTSSVANARRTTSGACTESTARASRGPTPLAVCNSSKTV